ncbi:PAS domain S-box protein [Methanonatronarchaeum sp. AMET-Sl]|uniref:PAS domain S-box protein n=1 Tax=Methanonatronarchaeum sp. AMET-Sl TaxID=3037654 RepID=UPI00244E5217|nr:PAS domain S-box protein [Methanonatronarchaeum sp. AMET-Sl]WGI17884.1 PAS domain S-box protein [Methanonatronarchaeum sp. AMET-Sl]
MAFNILLVDDEPGLLDLAEIYLVKESEDLEVETTSSAEKALELIKENGFDCVVSDYQMPSMDGLEFLEKLRNEFGMDIPFILFTGRGREEVAMKALNFGADRYIQKGGDPKSQFGVLADAIKQEVERYYNREKLLRSEKEKNLILESKTELIAYHEMDHTIRWANKAYADFVGLDKEELIGKKCYDAWLGRDTPCPSCPVEESLRHEEERERELSPPGEPNYFNIRSVPVKDEEGNTIGAIETVVDITERKEVEEKYRIIAEGSKNGIYIFQDREFKFINEAIIEMSGYTREELNNMRFLDLVHPDYRKKMKKCTEKILKDNLSGLQEKHEFRLLKKDGNTKWVQLTTSVIEYKGKPAIIGNVADITERKQVEKKLRERVKELKTLYKLSKISMETISIKELLKRTVDLIPPALQSPDIACAKAKWRDIEVQTDNYHETELKIRSNISLQEEGESFVEACYLEKKLEIDGSPFLEEEKNLIDTIAERLKEIIQFKENEKELREPRQDYKNLINGMNDTAWVIDLDGNIVEVNEASIKKLGYSRKELLSMKPHDIDASLEPGEITNLIKSMPEDEIQVFETTHETKRGEKIPVEINSSLITYRGDPAILSIARDITKRKEAKNQEELLHSLLRHDLRNKAQIVQGYHELLENYNLPEKAEKYLEKANKAVQDSINLIEKIKKLIEIRKKGELMEVNINPIINKIINENKPQTEEEGIEIEYKKLDCKVQAGPLTKELFSNIIENSIKHSDCNKIQISGKETDEKCIITIEDNGKGIPNNIKDKIFERGYKTGKKAGSGLGLYLVSKITEGYNGSIKVKDSKLGGARFDIELKKT